MIARGNGAACGDRGVYAHVNVAEAALQVLHQIKVPFPRFRVDTGGATAVNAVGDGQFYIA